MLETMIAVPRIASCLLICVLRVPWTWISWWAFLFSFLMQPQNWNMASQDCRGNFLWTLAMCLFHTKPQRRLRIYPVPVSCFNDDANTFRLQAIFNNFYLEVEPSKLCMPTCQMQVAPKICMWWEHWILRESSSSVDRGTSSNHWHQNCQQKLRGPLCRLGPLLTRMIGNTPNA